MLRNEPCLCFWIGSELNLAIFVPHSKGIAVGKSFSLLPNGSSVWLENCKHKKERRCSCAAVHGGALHLSLPRRWRCRCAVGLAPIEARWKLCSTEGALVYRWLGHLLDEIRSTREEGGGKEGIAIPQYNLRVCHQLQRGTHRVPFSPDSLSILPIRTLLSHTIATYTSLLPPR